jgi:polyhydroxyalkanoate synthesis regulator phasin
MEKTEAAQTDTAASKTEPAKDKKGLAEVFEKLWGQALLAVSNVEDEAQKVAQRVAESAGWNQDEVKRQVREFAERLAGQRRDLEKNVEEGVKRALARLKVPRRDEMQAIEDRLNRIAQRVDALSQK